MPPCEEHPHAALAAADLLPPIAVGVGDDDGGNGDVAMVGARSFAKRTPEKPAEQVAVEQKDQVDSAEQLSVALRASLG